MAETDDVTQAINMFKGLPQDRQAALLQRMTPDQKAKILAGLQARQGPAPSYVQSQKQAIDSEMEKADPGRQVTRDPQTGEVTMTQPGTLGSRAREAAIDALSPLTGQALLGAVQQGGQALWDMLSGRGSGRAQEVVKGAVTAPVQPVIKIAHGLKTGNYEEAAGGAGGFATQTAPAILGAVDAGTGAIDASSNAAREFAQNRLGVNALRTTEPIVRRYNAAAEAVPERQAAADAAAAEKNTQAAQTAAEKHAADTAKLTAKNEAAMHEADIKTEGSSADTLAKNNADRIAHEQAVKDVTEHNANVDAQTNRAASLDSQLREGSEDLGNQIVDLDKKLREEGNQKYDTVTAKVAGDKGVPTDTIVQAAKKARSMLKGAPESIRQFTDLMKKEADTEAPVANGVAPEPGTGLYKLMQEQGLIPEAETMPFDQLKGYSSELGRKLAEGGLPGDVYQAIKYLKQQIDAAKVAIAERHGATADLAAADKFWQQFQDTMYDKDSAVAKVRENVGVVDPEFYSEPFTKGKSAGVGASKLRGLPTQYSDIANGIADMTERLRKAYQERGEVNIPKKKEVPAPPTTQPQGPRAMATLEPAPTPVQPKVVTPETVQPPKPPTAEQILQRKKDQALGRAQSLGEMRHATAFENLSLPIKSITSNLLKRPAVVEWISRPTASDFAAIEALPDPIRTQIRTKLQQVVAEETKAGKPPRIDPRVGAFIGAAAPATNTTGGVQNRRQAMDAMGHPVP
jgi:hypothetical protein